LPRVETRGLGSIRHTCCHFWNGATKRYTSWSKFDLRTYHNMIGPSTSGFLAFTRKLAGICGRRCAPRRMLGQGFKESLSTKSSLLPFWLSLLSYTLALVELNGLSGFSNGACHQPWGLSG